ncbi:hypothetical protein QR98_0060830 [Sarcoptes scabiei]|uniref:Uncharacterized protein n=1 Tax=Sarcoptes scabiei TaxID=52283 RepID=A0A132A9C7_SARSC|nr:hypothetical protein QR98_0060830 [Sarcoptes scabiei]
MNTIGLRKDFNSDQIDSNRSANTLTKNDRLSIATNNDDDDGSQDDDDDDDDDGQDDYGEKRLNEPNENMESMFNNLVAELE